MDTYLFVRSPVVKSNKNWDSLPNQEVFLPKIEKKRLNLIKMKQLFKIKI
jgi:hypothetical protein